MKKKTKRSKKDILFDAYKKKAEQLDAVFAYAQGWCYNENKRLKETGETITVHSPSFIKHEAFMEILDEIQRTGGFHRNDGIEEDAEKGIAR